MRPRLHFTPLGEEEQHYAETWADLEGVETCGH